MRKEFNISAEFSCDVVIIGGGLAGTSAAITCARKGLDTHLIECDGALGGVAGIGLVTPLSSVVDKNGNSFGGLAEEISNAAMHYTKKYATGKGSSENVSPHITKLVLMKMCSDCGVKLHFHTSLVETSSSDGKIRDVIVLGKSGLIKINAKYFIDASGDGDLVYLSGDDFVLGSEPGVYGQLTNKGLDKVHESDEECKYEDAGIMQPVSIFFIMRGVDYEEAAKLNNKHLRFGDLGITRERFEKWEYAGSEGFEIVSDMIPMPQGRILVSRGRQPDEAVINMSRIVGINGADADSLSDGEMRAQLQILAIVDFLKTFIKPFENAYLTEVSSRLGVRETRRLKGKYVLSGKELIEGKTFEDTICRSYYIVDIHDPKGSRAAIGGEIDGAYYEVPYGSICSQNFNNLLVAGRCVSCDHVAASAVRIQGCCILTGQAAGCACVAAKRTEKEPCELDYEDLKKEILKSGIVI